MYHHLASTSKQIVGRKFLSLNRISESEIRVICEDGSFTVSVDGDCCSCSVFYDMIVPQECVGEEIFEVVEGSWFEPKLPEDEVFALGWPDNKYGPECLSIWDVAFKTKSGVVLLRHVNDSNGYYDGMTSYNFNQ